ncbi:MAG: DUF5107 domain-containing protein [Spirochaetaceae bacterium]|nr:DUF5107 domain-containing protein [Spirochaetaceae bacterium]
MKLKGSPLEGENPLPFFRQKDFDCAGAEGFPPDKYAGFGRETGFRVLPYRMQDRYTRALVDIELPSAVLENEYLKVEIAPSLGGRLWSLFDKKRGRDIVYRNPVFRPANLAIREAWFSGGIEWNIGRLGHTVHTCSPVFAGIVQDKAGGALRIWEFERQSGLFWRIELSLAENSPALFAYTRVENMDAAAKPFYWWANAAVPQTNRTRVLSASDEALYLVTAALPVKTLAPCTLPHIPPLPGKDASYPAGAEHYVEYFFQNDSPRSPGVPWEAAFGEDAYAFAEASTAPLVYRKMFCWGNGRGGRRWQDFLTAPPAGPYLEVQAGIAPTQLHTAEIAGGAVVDWAQAFSGIQLEPEKAHAPDYNAACAYTEQAVRAAFPPALLEDALEKGRERAGRSAEIVHEGSGWGALEHLRNRPVPAGLDFPLSSIGADEAPWAALARDGRFPPCGPGEPPGAFAGIDAGWDALLAASPPGDWRAPYHLGVNACEKGDRETARRLWLNSIDCAANPWAYRNLALIAADTEAALAYYRKALECGGTPLSIAEEYIPLLVKAGNWDEASAALDTYMREYGVLLENSPCALLNAAARLALERGDDALLDRICALEPAHIREGDNTLFEIWVERETRRHAARGLDTAAAKALVMNGLSSGTLSAPRRIDFRMFT